MSLSPPSSDSMIQRVSRDWWPEEDEEKEERRILIRQSP